MPAMRGGHQPQGLRTPSIDEKKRRGLLELSRSRPYQPPSVEHCAHLLGSTSPVVSLRLWHPCVLRESDSFDAGRSWRVRVQTFYTSSRGARARPAARRSAGRAAGAGPVRRRRRKQQRRDEDSRREGQSESRWAQGRQGSDSGNVGSIAFLEHTYALIGRDSGPVLEAAE